MYQEADDPNFIIRTSDNAVIPRNETFYAYQDFLAWLAEGNIPAPYVAPTTPTVEVLVPVYIFRDRFTQVELDAVNNLAFTGDVGAQRLLMKLFTATDGIPIASQTVIDGLDYLVSKGVLTANRPAEILVP